MLFNVVLGSLGLMFGPLGGHLGALLAALGRLDGSPKFSNFFFGTLEPPRCLPKSPSTALNSAPGALNVKQKAPRSHQRLHFGTDAFRHLTMLEQNHRKK